MESYAREGAKEHLLGRAAGSTAVDFDQGREQKPHV